MHMSGNAQARPFQMCASQSFDSVSRGGSKPLMCWLGQNEPQHATSDTQESTTVLHATQSLSCIHTHCTPLAVLALRTQPSGCSMGCRHTCLLAFPVHFTAKEQSHTCNDSLYWRALACRKTHIRSGTNGTEKSSHMAHKTPSHGHATQRTPDPHQQFSPHRVVPWSASRHWKGLIRRHLARPCPAGALS